MNNEKKKKGNVEILLLFIGEKKGTCMNENGKIL